MSENQTSELAQSLHEIRFFNSEGKCVVENDIETTVRRLTHAAKLLNAKSDQRIWRKSW